MRPPLLEASYSSMTLTLSALAEVVSKTYLKEVAKTASVGQLGDEEGGG